MNAENPIIWTGNLQDDCTAIWNGLILRAEWMEGDLWWWAVSVNDGRVDEIDSSNEHQESCIGGANARKSAEEAAISYFKNMK